MTRIAYLALIAWLIAEPRRATAADPAAVPIDIAIGGMALSLALGAVIAACLLWGRQRARRLSSARYFHERQPQRVPVWNEWTPAHGEWAAHLNASRRLH